MTAKQGRLIEATRPRDMFAEYAATDGHMAEGWMAACPSCGRFMWNAWRSDLGKAIRRERDGVSPHSCPEAQ